jgi:hypothetical protein
MPKNSDKKSTTNEQYARNTRNDLPVCFSFVICASSLNVVCFDFLYDLTSSGMGWYQLFVKTFESLRV